MEAWKSIGLVELLWWKRGDCEAMVESWLCLGNGGGGVGFKCWATVVMGLGSNSGIFFFCIFYFIIWVFGSGGILVGKGQRGSWWLGGAGFVWFFFFNGFVIGLWRVWCHGGCYVVVIGFYDSFYTGLWLGLWLVFG